MTTDIVVNGRFLSRRVTGVERYGREILPLFNGRYRVEKTWMNGMAGHIWEQFVLPVKLRSKSVLWSPANTGPLMAARQVLTIHDLSPIEHPEWFKADFAFWYRLFLPILIRRVQVILTPSNYVKQKVMRRFGVRNVIVTPNSVDTSRFCPNARQDTYDLPEKFILFVGSQQPRKNLNGLLKAWHQIKDEITDLWLVVVGHPGTIFAKTDLTATEHVMLPGYVNEHDLPGIYAKATLFVLPSFDEGFGLPALEAMASGVPVVVSNGGALAETVGDAARIFKITEPINLTDTIRECLEDNLLRQSLIAKGFERVKRFTWQSSAGLVWMILNEI